MGLIIMPIVVRTMRPPNTCCIHYQSHGMMSEKKKRRNNVYIGDEDHDFEPCLAGISMSITTREAIIQEFDKS